MFDRRRFLGSSVCAAAAGVAHPWLLAATANESSKPGSPPVERLGIGAIGLRYQGTVVTHQAAAFGVVVAVCDVDRHVRDQAKASFGSTPYSYEDYRDLLERQEVDVVIIGSPDHWHAKMVIDACRAGKDVYVEKPLTLTVDEGKQIRKVQKETGQIVQVGSWQRSDSRFRLAVEMVRQGRIGDLQKVEVVLGKNEVGGPFEKTPVPKNLNWNLWQGQTPDVPYIQERAHYTFRWWKEYSGGQMTDWGAHHLDIAEWAIDSFPIMIEGHATFPEAGDHSYNVAVDYDAKYQYANGVEMTVTDSGRNGIMFTGTEGRIFVNRGTLSGAPVEDLKTNPLRREDFAVYPFDNLDRPERAGKLDAVINHVGNFFDCVETRKLPISDIESQHRSATTCHLGNICMKLRRSLWWDPETELFIGDTEANLHLRREQRKGFETS